MSRFLRTHWFVLALPLAVGLAWIVPAAGASGGWLRSEITTKLAVVLIFLFQGLTLATPALLQGARQWRLHLLVQAFTFLLFPLMGMALDAMAGAHLSSDLRLGFLFLCVLPSTISSSVVLTSMAGGNTAGAIFNAVLSNLLGIVITPLWVAWLMKAGGQAMPLGPVIREIVLLLLLPFVVGQLARLRLHAWANANRGRMNVVSSGLILFIVFAAFCNSVESQVWVLHGIGTTGVALAGAAVILALAMGAVGVLSRLLGLNRPDRIAAAFCAPQKTLAAGVPLAQIIFGLHPGLGLILLPVMLYHPLQLLVCGMLAARWGRQSESEGAPVKSR